ncbi:MAG TPA: glycosyltransferase [Clostridiales bacterium]|nr:glycosyltransferase [Clostridiales bacterium]
MNKRKSENIILIPSLEPDSRLLTYVQELQEHGLTDIIIVDDGSGEKYRWIFQKLGENGCVVLRHEENKGKGCALKTGFQYIQRNFDHFTCVVTADSDGQHASEDVYRLAKEAEKHPGALVLGVRDFTAPGIPPKSLFGNRFSSLTFAALYGKRLPDTQTGLRAFGPQLLAFLLEVSGSRFEYELQMLISCVQSGIPILTLPIRIIYENGNAGTHFKPIRDSIRVIKILVSNFIKFSISSIASAAVDLGIAWFLLDFFRSFLPQQEFLRILLATVTARILSIAVNYLLNKHFVFRGKEAGSRSLWRYLLLCMVIILLSSTGVYLLHTVLLINEKSGKLICDTLLFLLSYQAQQRWVFKKGGVNSGT